MNRKIDEQELREFMAKMGPETRIYFGCDSTRFRTNNKWFAEYATVIVVHIDGKHGGKVFAELSVEPDHDGNASRPFQRMMTEATKVSDLFNKFKDVFEDFECEIHIDINSKKTAGSSVALEAAIGYIKGVTNVTPLGKPLAWAASFGADRAPEILEWQRAK